MEKNPLQQQQGKYPWEKINKIEIIPQCPNHTMVIDNREGDRDIHRTQEKITEMPSNGSCNGQRNDIKPTLVQTQVKRNDFKPTSCFSLDRWRLRFDGVMKCERKWRKGSEKGENFG